MNSLSLDFDSVKSILLDRAFEHPLQYYVGALICAVLYRLIFIELLVPFSTRYHSSQPYWDSLMKREGVFCENGQEEVVVLSVLGPHHVFGGSLMVAGTLLSSVDLWKAGVMVEVGFELYDTYALIVSAYPFSGNVKPELKRVILAHHMPGLFAMPFLLQRGYAESINVQIIAESLLLAGGISVIVSALTYTCDFEKDMFYPYAYQLGSWVSMLVARVFVFPYYTYQLVWVELRGDSTPTFVIALVSFTCVAMMLFNVVVFAVGGQKVVKYRRAYIDQRAERSGDRKGKLVRSDSLKDALEAERPPPLTKRASSIISLLGTALDADSVNAADKVASYLESPKPKLE